MEDPDNNRKRPRSTWQSRGRSRRRVTGGESESKNAKKPPPPTPKCSVCTTGEPNYKCPKCLKTYCSIACCRKHKEGLCSGKKQEEASTASGDAGVKSKYDVKAIQPIGHPAKRDPSAHEDLEEGWKMTPEMIETMHGSEWLHQELADQGLRTLIERIATASNVVQRNHNTQQEDVIEELFKEHPMLKLFVDKLLVHTGVLVERQREDTSDDLHELLQDEGGNSRCDLELKPLVRRTRAPLKADEESSSNSDSEVSTDSSSEVSSSDSDDSSD
jgi:hypothetical protein